MHNMNMKHDEVKQTLTIEINLRERGVQTANGNDKIASTSNWEKLDDVLPGLSINMALVLSKKGARS